jgi:LAO/AO transport system kinase
MKRFIPSLELLERAALGQTHAIGRLISRAEAGSPEARSAFATIYRRTGRTHVIGLTGVPGGGKSTIAGALIARLREKGDKVGVVAIDPSSPYSGGAILGDRIRMSQHGKDEGVYIRSMATRGATGGIARAALDAVDVLDLSGFATVIVETVGVGQDEVEIAKASHTTIVVSPPGLGDEIQAIKAGILEIADIHVVSKFDRSDARRTLVDLNHMLLLGLDKTAPPEWRPPIIGVSAITGEGLDALVDAIAAHRTVAFESERGSIRRNAIATFRLQKTCEDLLLERFFNAAAPLTPPLAERLQHRDGDPYTLANEVLAAALA